MEQVDPGTGEITEADDEIAADGGRRYPAASTLNDLIAMLRDGQFNADTSEVLREFSEKLEAIGQNTDRKAKGKIVLTIEVDYDPDRDFSVLVPTLVCKLPTEKHGATVAWFTSDGRMTPNKPNQGHLFGTMRDVNAQREVR